MARWVKSHNQMTVFKQTATPAVADGLAIGDIWLDINSGAVLKVCTAISPVTFASDSLDGSNNFSANNLIPGYTTTATAATTTTLTVASTEIQVFTGSATQIVNMPVVSTLALGTSYRIVNISSNNVTVNSSGANVIQIVQANSTLELRSIAITGTNNTVWNVDIYVPAAMGQTGSGSLVRSTSPVLVTPTLGGASASSLAFSSTSGIIGTTTNDSAAAGSVGATVVAVLDASTPSSLTTTTNKDIVSISLTAGDWDVDGVVGLTPAVTTNVVQVFGWISTTSATLPASYLYMKFQNSTAGEVPGSSFSFLVSRLRVSVATTTTVYLSTRAAFSVDTMGGYGKIEARRRR